MNHADQQLPNRDIPDTIKRQVRQECGFGCVICGAPIFEYDHIVDFKESKDHSRENIALLCSIHHRDKTSKRLDRSTVTRFRNAPHNLNQKISPPHVFYTSTENFCLMVGTNKVICSTDFLHDGFVFEYLKANEETLISTKFCEIGPKQFMPLPSVRMLKENGDTLLWIDEGELVYGLDNWDVEIEGQNIKIRESLGKIISHIIQNPTTFRVQRGVFFYKKNKIIIDGEKVIVNGTLNRMGGSVIYNCNGALRLKFH